MGTHLSARLTWHDTGWDGRVCRDPLANVYCTAHEHIRDRKRDSDEVLHAAVRLATTAFRPPCSRDPGAFSPESYTIEHRDPLTWRGLGTVVEELPAYSFSTSPYGHMFSEAGGWEYDRDTQLRRLDEFFSALDPGRSLVFFYLKDGQPFLETAQRIVCGIGRIATVGPQLLFPGSYQGKSGFPVWARAVTCAFPREGFRLPLQEYWAAERDVTPALCVVPPSAQVAFSYVAEHVSDDVAVTIIEQLLDAARWLRADGAIPVGWDARIAWLEEVLSEVWRDRGPFPGLPAVLAYLGCTTGASLLRERVLRGRAATAWADVERVLDGAVQDAPPRHASGLIRASAQWRALPESRRELLRVLARMDLTAAQVERIAHPEQRVAAGITFTDEQLSSNPYAIAETDLGTDESAPLAFETIDHALLPALGVATGESVARQDDRRVRAAMHEVLREAAADGDTVLRLDDVTSRLTRRFSGERRCVLDWDIVRARRDFYAESIWIDETGQAPVIAARAVAEDEQALRTRFERIAGKTIDTRELDWAAILERVLREAAARPSEDEPTARAEKSSALARAVRMRLSVITGRAGTGKTTVARALLDGIDELDGRTGALLLAPTGKARIRLEQTTKRPALTIHQFLAEHDWIQFGNAFALKRTGGTVDSASTVLIDEASMVPTDLLAALFRALDWNRVRRLVLMGDVNQLPPIGPGRPFADLIAWLDADPTRATRVLRLEQRGRFADAHSLALQLSDGYVAGHTPPGDDEVLARVARKDLPSDCDLEVHFWNDPVELARLLDDRIAKLVLSGSDDYRALDASLRRNGVPAPEQWQILSPVRRQPFGTDELNRTIQLKYRRGLIEMARQRAFVGNYQLARPAGDQQIVWNDKVIQVMNEWRRSWSKASRKAERRYVANGEVGLVTTALYSNGADRLKVTFGTQPDLQFQYSRGAVAERLELAYAITVHKCQGSDFEVVFLILPQKAGTLSRELIYTALTRFKAKLVLFLERDVRMLQQFRRPSTSETLQRNTNLFVRRIRPEGVPLPYPEKLIHRTTADELVRSKSEVVVAETLKSLGISYRYEEALYAMDDSADFRIPDFTVYYEGDTWYWEHLGMLSTPSYAEAWQRKQQWYERQGLLDRVITSEDGPDGSIDALKIAETARARILGQ